MFRRRLDFKGVGGRGHGQLKMTRQVEEQIKQIEL